MNESGCGTPLKPDFLFPGNRKKEKTLYTQKQRNSKRTNGMRNTPKRNKINIPGAQKNKKRKRKGPNIPKK